MAKEPPARRLETFTTHPLTEEQGRVPQVEEGLPPSPPVEVLPNARLSTAPRNHGFRLVSLGRRSPVVSYLLRSFTAVILESVKGIDPFLPILRSSAPASMLDLEVGCGGDLLGAVARPEREERQL